MMDAEACYNLDTINVEVIKLEREIHTEQEYCKHLSNAYKTVSNDGEMIQKDNAEKREHVFNTMRRERLIVGNIESTRKSSKLMSDVLLDLKKQHHLERLTTAQKLEKYKTTISRYETVWKNYQEIYMKFPLAKETSELRVALRIDSMKLAVKNVEQEELNKKLEILQCIRERQIRLQTIKVAELMVNKKLCAKKNLVLQKNLRELQIEMAVLRSQELNQEKQGGSRTEIPVQSSISQPVMEQIPVKAVAPSIMTAIQQREAYSTPIRTFQKSLLLASMELSLAELPVLKIPVFNAPPRKTSCILPQYTPPNAHMLNAILFSEPVRSETTPIQQDTITNGTNKDDAMEIPSPLCDRQESEDMEQVPQPIPEENMELQEEEPNADCSKTTSENDNVDKSMNDDAVIIYDANEEHQDLGISPPTTQHSCNESMEEEILDDDSRREYLDRLKKSPQVQYTARTCTNAWESEERDYNKDDAGETTSSYFEQQEHHSPQDVVVQVTEVQSVSTEENLNSSCTENENQATDSVDALLAKFHHTAYVSPDVSMNLDEDIDLQQRSQQPASDNSSGLFFNFGNTPNQNTFATLFGGGDASTNVTDGNSESNIGNKGSEAFNFTFDKSKSSSFFKLF